MISDARKTEDGRLVEARKLYESAVFGGDKDATAAGHRELDSLEADLALSHGRLLHAEFLATREENSGELPSFKRAAKLYTRIGDTRGLADAEFWIGCYHQVVHGDEATALRHLQRSYELAREADDPMIMSYAARHLGFVDLAAGRPREARDWLEESVRLRRDLDFPAGVAAGLLALAELDWTEERRDDAWWHLEEAAALARECGASGTLGWIDATRAEWTA